MANVPLVGGGYGSQSVLTDAAKGTSLQGQNGVEVTTNTSAVTGTFYCIQVLEDTVFSTFTESLATGQAMTGFTILAGTFLYGKITAYTLTSGKVRAYKTLT